MNKENEMGMSGYSKFAWTLWKEARLPMATCEIVEQIIKELGYRKQTVGEWVKQGERTHYCSNCGHDATYTFDGTEICGITCPFCGANMKGE
jgi:hypothetical protein